MSDDDEALAPPIPPLEPVLPSLRDHLIRAGILTPREEISAPPPPVGAIPGGARAWPRIRGYRGGRKHRVGDR